MIERLRQFAPHLDDDAIRLRLSAAVAQARSRGLRARGAIERYVTLMFALEPQFERRARAREHFAGRTLEAALLNLDAAHPNFWQRAEPAVAEEQWRALSGRAVDDVVAGDAALPLPPQLAPNYGFQLDAPRVDTPGEVVQAMLELAQVGPSDVVMDLGSGDGRIVIAAAQRFGARGVGVELNAENIAAARRAAEEAGVAGRVSFLRCDLHDAPLDDVTVVTMYLLRHVNLALRDKLRRELRDGARVVSRHFDMGDWRPAAQSGRPPEVLYCWRIGATERAPEPPSSS